MQTATGKCKDKKHKLTWKKDGEKRSFLSCNDCGVAPVNMRKK